MELEEETSAPLEATEQEIPFEPDWDAVNLVPEFEAHPEGQEALKRIADEVWENWHQDWEHSEAYREKAAKNLKLFTGDIKKKDFPFKDAANAHVPILMEMMVRVTFRVVDEIIGDRENIFNVLPIGPDDEEVAAVLTDHGNWQIREQMPDFIPQQHRGILQFFMNGTAICHSYYDSFRRRNRHDMLNTDEFVVPYVYTSSMPDLSDVPRRTRICFYYRHELQQMKGLWTNVDKLLNEAEPKADDEPELPLHESVADANKVELPDDKRGSAFKVLWYEGWMSLPQHEDDRFVQVIMECNTRIVLHMTIWERPNELDQSRFERQVREKEMAIAAVQQHQQQLQEIQGQFQMVEEMRASGEMDQGMAAEIYSRMEQQLPEAPGLPDWMKGDLDAKPEPVRMEPIHLFSRGACIEPLVGPVGIGYGRIQADYNRTANTVLKQFIDAATLANVPGWLVADGVEMPKGGVTFSPGQFTKVEGVEASELANAVIPIQPKAANPQLREVMEMVRGFAQDAVQAPDVLSGYPGKSGETYRGLGTRLEQASKMLSVPSGKYMVFFEQIIKNNAWLNSIFLNDDEIVRIVDHKMHRLRQIRVGRHMYRRDYRVVFRADKRFSSKEQRIAQADEMVQMANTFPPLQMNIPFQHAAFRKSLEARDMDDMVQLLGPSPPPPQTPFGMPPPGRAGPGVLGGMGPPGPPGKPMPGKGGGSSPAEGPPKK